MCLAEFLYEREYLVSVLRFKFDQVLEKFVKNFREQKTLLHCRFSKEKVNFFSKSGVVFRKVEKHNFDLIVIEGKHLVESRYSVEGSDTDFVDFIVEHVNQKV